MKTQNELHEAMKNLAKSTQVLAGQLDRLEEVPISDQLHSTMREFPNMMEDLVCNLTDLWLVSATMAKNVETAIDKELRDLVSTLRDHRLRHHEPCMAGTRPGILQEFDRSLIIDIRVPVFVPDPFFLFYFIFKKLARSINHQSSSHRFSPTYYHQK